MSYATWSLVYGEKPSTAKWNILGSNDAHFYDFLGSNLTWQSWTPVLSGGLTKGNGTTQGKYTTIGKLVICRFLFLYGSTSSWSGAVPFISLPVTADTTIASTQRIIGLAMLESIASASWLGYLKLASSTTVEPVAFSANATYPLVSRLTSAVPFTWAANDYIAGTMRYFK